ncbi:MAG: ABC transporter [Acidimicrobiia bacterium]
MKSLERQSSCASEGGRAKVCEIRAARPRRRTSELRAYVRMGYRSVRALAMFGRILVIYVILLGLRRILGRDRSARVEEGIHLWSARTLYKGFLSLEGVYIKLGQFMSMLTGLLPDQYLDELEKLQDAVPPRPYEAIAARITTELEKPIEAVFEELEEKATASASLGQVHLGRLRDGREVAVKVQYPGIEQVVRTDLAVVRLAASVIDFFFPELNYRNVYEDLKKTITRELDYLNEGRSAERIAANFADNDHVEFPLIYWEYTTSKVLCMERKRGIKILDVAAIKEAGIRPIDVIEILVQAYFKQLLVDGFYHADPHPGNFFVKKAADGRPTIVFLDFGAVAEFPKDFKDGMRTVVYGYMLRDDKRVIEGMRQMGFEAAGADEEIFEKAVRHYMDKLLHFSPQDFSKLDLREFDIRKNLEEMQLSFRELARTFQVPRNWFYVERTLTLLMGLCARLDPKVDAFLYGFPYAVEFVFGGDSKLAAIWGTTSDPTKARSRAVKKTS